MAKIVSEGGAAQGTRVLLDDGHELLGLQKVTFTAEAGDICRIDAEIVFASIEAEGKLTVYAPHPETGILGELSKVVFSDGTEWTAP